MTSDNIYEAQDLTPEIYKIFAGVYSDFRVAAINEYKFELEPLSYEDFISSIEKGLIKCIVLSENKFPTAFLVYTTVISEAIELNVIHCLGDDDLIEKRRVLLEKFLEETEELRKEKIVCYPMLGSQGDFTADIAKYGFKFVGLAVLRFVMQNASSKTIFNTLELPELDTNYEIKPWSEDYIEEAVAITNRAFIDTTDALFDPRFKTPEGTRDVLENITNGTYGEFLPESTSVLMYCGKPCGFCFTNLTGGRIANIPIFAIDKPFQGKGLSKYLLKTSIQKMLDWVENGEKDIEELNTTTETNNFQALKMYRGVGFKEDYSYAQSYTTI